MTATDDRVEGVPARYWHTVEDGRVQCDLCPRECRLREGQRGFCFVRARSGDELVLTTYGRSSGFCIDPIEKKPLSHFLPGSAVLSFGTAGCNLGCRFCQNHEISTSRHMDRLAAEAGPADIAAAAADWGCDSVALTYNDPVIFAEYGMDVADACRERGIASVAVTAGYVQGEARREFFDHMDAANVDLKGFSDEFYVTLTGARLRPVLDTLVHLVHETDVWIELTTLLIPGRNDSDAELTAMARWIVAELGPDVPHHFSAFHPDHRMPDVPPTPVSTLTRARDIARAEGIRYVYTGNVHHREGEATSCPGCGELLVERDRYELLSYRIEAPADGRPGPGRCPSCGTAIAGRFTAEPGTFGRRRIPIAIRSR